MFLFNYTHHIYYQNLIHNFYIRMRTKPDRQTYTHIKAYWLSLTHTHKRIYFVEHTQTHTYTLLYTYTYMHIYTVAHTHTLTHTHTHTRMHNATKRNKRWIFHLLKAFVVLFITSWLNADAVSKYTKYLVNHNFYRKYHGKLESRTGSRGKNLNWGENPEKDLSVVLSQ